MANVAKDPVQSKRHLRVVKDFARAPERRLLHHETLTAIIKASGCESRARNAGSLIWWRFRATAVMRVGPCPATVVNSKRQMCARFVQTGGVCLQADVDRQFAALYGEACILGE